MSSRLVVVPPYAIMSGGPSVVYCSGKGESEDIPNRDLLELSPDALSEERTDPVCGQSVTIDPPPPPASDEEGFDVDTQTASLRRDIIQRV